MSFLENKILSVVLLIIIVLGVFYHINTVYTLKSEKKKIIFSTKTIEKQLTNNEKAYVKGYNSDVERPEIVGFSKEFLNDTINKVLGIKVKELRELHQINGILTDSLKLLHNKSNDNIRVFVSKNNKDSLKTTISILPDSTFVLNTNVNLITAIKKGKEYDSIIFYDPTQRIKINDSKDFVYTLKPKTVKKKFTFSVQTGTGIVFPEFDRTKVNWGGYVGVGISYNF